MFLGGESRAVECLLWGAAASPDMWVRKAIRVVESKLWVLKISKVIFFKKKVLCFYAVVVYAATMGPAVQRGNCVTQWGCIRKGTTPKR